MRSEAVIRAALIKLIVAESKRQSVIMDDLDLIKMKTLSWVLGIGGVKNEPKSIRYKGRKKQIVASDHFAM